MNKPLYKIGDRLPKSNFVVRGVMTTSCGEHRYFLQIFDNSIVINELDLESTIALADWYEKENSA